LNVFVVEKPAEIAVAFGPVPTGRQALLQPGLIDIANGSDFHIALGFEVVSVKDADQAISDNSHLNPIVGAAQARVSCRRHRAQESPSRKVHLYLPPRPEHKENGGMSQLNGI
jgi:hypothetical protein